MRCCMAAMTVWFSLASQPLAYGCGRENCVSGTVCDIIIITYYRAALVVRLYRWLH